MVNRLVINNLRDSANSWHVRTLFGSHVNGPQGLFGGGDGGVAYVINRCLLQILWRTFRTWHVVWFPFSTESLPPLLQKPVSFRMHH